ncbi:hypothetical protein [Thermomonospora umbrina]|uniref:Uncharacterized protein n=1 Tax=Thermomonospora umbrina TaxID=111806 RepID=A0A3D9SY42_9ACTN|nr:hypothetical protein [Thermomonospora umbrina]REE97915.1 hypothetical protein DFJ69_3395 [Thermomonospora umbrina]
MNVMLKGAAAVLVAIACFGCGGQPPTARAARPTPPAKVLQDRGPIEELFPKLGRFTTVYWTEKTPPAGRFPLGPSVYTIEAVVVLRPADAKHLQRNYKWNLVTVPTVGPELVSHLGAALSDKRWLHSEDFDQALVEDAPRITDAWLNPLSRTMFLRSHTM